MLRLQRPRLRSSLESLEVTEMEHAVFQPGKICEIRTGDLHRLHRLHRHHEIDENMKRDP